MVIESVYPYVGFPRVEQVVKTSPKVVGAPLEEPRDQLRGGGDDEAEQQVDEDHTDGDFQHAGAEHGDLRSGSSGGYHRAYPPSCCNALRISGWFGSRSRD